MAEYIILLKCLISPLFLIIVLLTGGVLLLFLKNRVTLAKFALVLVCICLFLLSFRPFSDFLSWNLEKRYPPIDSFSTYRNINYIVVLTAWDRNDPTVPYTSNLGYSSAFRVLEAHRIFMHLPQCKIIISGDKVSTEAMANFMILLGIRRESIILENRSLTTWESAVNVKKILSKQPFFLVTSAIHLPRAMYSFIKQDLRAVAAPADFSYGYYKNFDIPTDRPLAYYVPNINSL